MPKKWQHLGHSSSQNTGASWSVRQRRRGRMDISTKTRGQWDMIALQMVDTFWCHTSHPIFPATEPSPLGHLRKGDCHPDHAGRQPTMYLQLCDPESLVLAPRKFGRRNSKSTSTPEQLTLITQKGAEHITSSSDSLLTLTANRETLTHRASEQAEFARTVDIGQLYIANEPVIDENSSSPLCR